MKKTPTLAVALLFCCANARAMGAAGFELPTADFLSLVAGMQSAKIGRHAAPSFDAKSAFPGPIERAYSVRGIDVSHYEGAIDWSQVKTENLSFAFIKATDGDNLLDDRFAANWKGAAAIGLRKGAYHFYNFCKDAAPQAALFIKTVPAEADSLPPTIDLEKSKECRNLPEKEAFRKQLDVFIARVAAAYGKQPILYVSYRVYDKYFAGDSGNLRLWLPDYQQTPRVSDNRDWLLWQFSEKGRIKGVGGAVDLDVFSGDAARFAALDAAPALEYAFADRGELLERKNGARVVDR